MPFPLDQRSEFSWQNLRALNVEEFRLRFLAQAASELRAVKARNVEVRNNKVWFKGGVFRFVPNWNILIWIDRGYIEAVPSAEGLSIRYLLSFRHLLIASSCAAAALLLLMTGNNSSLSAIEVIALSVSVWFLCFGLNWLIAIVRFPLLIERILRDTRI